MRLEDVPLDCIKVGKDRRHTHHEKIKTIAESIQRIGLLQPIGITEGYDLVYGEHRLGAYKLLGKKTITCRFVKEGDEELAEIDENTERINLDALEFTQAMARKKKEWERRNGKPTPGPKGGNPANVCANSEPTTTFSEKAAKAEGVSRRTVEVAAAIGEKLTEKAVDVIAGTPIADNQKAIAAIAAAPPAKQVAVAKEAVKTGKAPSKPKEKKPKAAPEPVDESLPEHLRLIAADTTLKGYVKTLTDAVKEIKRIGNEVGGRFLVSAEIIDHLNQARNLIANGMFHCPCPRCEGKKSGCHACRKSGWLPKWALEELEATF